MNKFLTAMEGSKKSLNQYIFAVSEFGKKTNCLSKHNLEVELNKIDAPSFVYEYIGKILGLFEVPKNHIPLTKLALDKNILCQGSAPGHFTLLPKGQFIYKTIEKYGKQLFGQYFPSIDLKVPVVFSPNTDGLLTLTEKFGIQYYNRMVPVKDIMSERGANHQHYLRYAGDPDVFNYLSNKTFRTKELPLLFFSYGDTIRNDFELSGIIRTAGFYLPCHHIISTEESYFDDYINAHKITSNIMKAMFPYSKNFLIVDIEEQYLNSNPDLIEKICDTAKTPLVVKIFREKNHYYSVQHQYYFKLVTGHFIQVGNLQVDFENGKKVSSNGQIRFNISYNKKANKPVVIIHGLATGRNMTVLSTLLNERLEEKQNGKLPTFPFEFSPYQFRVLTVNSNYAKYANDLVQYLKSNLNERLRVMSDNRDIGLREKIRDAGVDWVPYTLIIGDKELKTGSYKLNDRNKNKNGLFRNIKAIKELAEDISLFFDEIRSRDDLFKLNALEYEHDPFNKIEEYDNIPAFIR